MIDCIIPAAGTSSRMRSWKLFLPFKDKPVIDHILEAALLAADRIIIVSGFKSDALEEHIENLGLNKDRYILTCNPKYYRGMFSSIQEGVKHSQSSLFFIMLADLPLVQANTYAQLLTYHNSCDEPFEIIQPMYKNTPGHPVLLSGTTRKVIETLPPTASMREVFSRCRIKRLPWDDPSIIWDIDTPEAYKTMLRSTT